MDASASYAQAVAWAVANGITKGATDTTFAPENISDEGQDLGVGAILTGGEFVLLGTVGNIILHRPDHGISDPVPHGYIGKYIGNQLRLAGELKQPEAFANRYPKQRICFKRTDNRQQLFLLAPEKDAYLVPIPKDELSYTLPADGKTEATGNPTAAQLGFSAAQDGTITCNSDRLYELFETNTLLRITVGESFWLFQLSGGTR